MRTTTFLLILFSLTACVDKGKENTLEAFAERTARAQIDEKMDTWHRAAAEADEDTFFGTMTDSAIYLGTDKSERWLRDELRDWSAEYFARDKAWDFTPYDRHVYFAQDGRTAWFEELLDTWMGPCRGSGVMTRTGEGWKLAHYNLAMLIDNEDVQEVIEITQRPNAQPDSLPDSQ